MPSQGAPLKRAIASAVTVVALVACSPPLSSSSDGGAPRSAGEYADSLCTSLGRWLSAIGAANTSQLDTSSPKTLKAGIIKRFQTKIQATDRLLHEVELARLTGVNRGDDVQAEVTAGLEATVGAFAYATDKVRALPDTAKSRGATAEFNRTLFGIQSDAIAAVRRNTAFLDAIPSEELDAAMRDSEVCADVRNSDFLE